MALQLDVFLLDRQRGAASNQKLLANDVYTADHLGHRVLYLNPGIHLDKVKRIVLEQEFEGTGTPIIHIEAGAHTRLTNFIPERIINTWRRGFFDDLLMTPLKGAVTITQVNRIPLTVREHLNLNVPWTLEELLHVHHRRAKGRLRFGLGYLNRGQ